MIKKIVVGVKRVGLELYDFGNCVGIWMLAIVACEINGNWWWDNKFRAYVADGRFRGASYPELEFWVIWFWAPILLLYVIVSLKRWVK